MGILSSITGNAGPMDPQTATQEYGRLLAQGEQIQSAFQFVRDAMLFTNTRLIQIDKQGVTGRKVEYHSIPYRSISHFAVETAGHFDLDGELRIWVGHGVEPISTEFNKQVDVYQVQALLAAYVAR